MEKPIEGPRYALVLRKGQFANIKLADLRLFDEQAQIYIGRYIDVEGVPTTTTDRDIPVSDVVKRWDTIPYPEEVNRTKRAIAERYYRERQLLKQGFEQYDAAIQGLTS